MDAYEKMIERLKKEHEEWLEQNWKLRGLEHALEQIHSEGDIKVDYATEILRKEYEELKRKNSDLCVRVLARREFIKEYEADMGIKSKKLNEIFGY